MNVLKKPLEANPDHTINLSFQTSIMMVITRMLRRYLLSFNWKDAPVSVGRRAGQSSFFFIVIAITLIKVPGTETILNLLKKKYLTISGKSN